MSLKLGTNHKASLLDYFSTFGNIKSICLIKGKKTKISKGYGFIKCTDDATFKRILEFRPHMLGDRIVDVNYSCEDQCVPFEVLEMKMRKIYISDIPLEATKSNLSGG